jgi:hypothetical protein
LFSYNKAILVFSVFISLGISILNSFYLESFSLNKMYKFDFIIMYLLFFTFLIFFIVGLMCKNIKVIKFIHFGNFYLQIWVLICLRYTMITLVKLDSNIIFYMYLIDINLRLAWVLLFLHSFVESLILNFLSILTIWLTIPFLYTSDQFITEISIYVAYSSCKLVVIFFSYIISWQQKRAFHFHWIADQKANWLTSVFENMKSGFVSIKGGKITYINSFMLNQFKKIKTDSFKDNFTKELKTNNRNESKTNIFIFRLHP